MFLIRPSIVAAAISGIYLLFLNSGLVAAQCTSNLHCLDGTFCDYYSYFSQEGTLTCVECPPPTLGCSGSDLCKDACEDNTFDDQSDDDESNYLANCGGHTAKDCGSCPWNGDIWMAGSWCNGDCVWMNEECIEKANTHECDDFMVGSQAKKECLENYYNFKNLCNLYTCENINYDNDLPSMWRCDDGERYSLSDDEYEYLWLEIAFMQEENTCKKVCYSNLDCSGGTFCDYNSIFSQDGTCEECPPPTLGSLTLGCSGSHRPSSWSVDSCEAACEDNDEAIDESNCALLFSGPGLDSTDGSALNECLRKSITRPTFATLTATS